MEKNAKWIWLNREKYPTEQESEYTFYCEEREYKRYVLAEFKIEKTYELKISKIEIDICADVKYWLYVNDDFVGLGSVCAGGDYNMKSPMPKQYYNSHCIDIESHSVKLYAMVQKNTTVECDTSRGHGGLIVSATLHFEDGSRDIIVTDENWQARINRQRYSENKTDYTLVCDGWENAELTENIWNLEKSPIRLLCLDEVFSENIGKIIVKPGEYKKVDVEFDKIYSGYVKLNIAESNGHLISVKNYERYRERSTLTEVIIGKAPLNFQGLKMNSIGGLILEINNTGNRDIVIDSVSLMFSYYPTEFDGTFSCSNETLNTIYEMGKWSLKICRQSIELDSPKHQENLGCVGDYYIASLMNYFTYGNSELTRFDLKRIADYLIESNGYMFHTTYSMIWILMLYDYYIYSGDKKILSDTKPALEILLKRFERTTDERGIITNPENYMFVDWVMVEEHNMHHPPAALGQTVLNAFYYAGLVKAAEIFAVLNDFDKKRLAENKAEKLKTAFNKYFYDAERQLYFDGLNEINEPAPWKPKNSEKRYYSQHSNTLAILFDLAPSDMQKGLMQKILQDESLIKPQPYFMHFVLEAIYKTGLFCEYGIEQIMRWSKMTEFKKGLQEGWYDFSGYGFDYSHVWGGTPTYQLPSKLIGLKIIEPGFKKVELKPNLYGLDYANIKIPTPYGYISVEMNKEKVMVDAPEQIKIILI